jgi:hypothetical protein
MNKIVASIGLVALGATGVQAQYASPISMLPSKPWSVAATLRGFYDDNIDTVPSGGNRVGAFGFEVSPSISTDWAFEQTLIVATYSYALNYYSVTPYGNSVPYDQEHTFTAEIDHNFNERYQLRVNDSFVIGQEPDTLRAGNAFSNPYRVPGNNIVNYGTITLNAQMTPLFGLQLGYANALYHYVDRDYFILADSVAPSNSGDLDRIDQTAHIEGHWNMLPETVGVLGYAYEQVDYTGNQPIAMSEAGNLVYSDSRNVQSHSLYIGADHSFRPDLSGSVRVGAAYYDYYNDPNHTTSFGPTAQASLQYIYAMESYVQIGFQEARTATDLTGQSDGQYVNDMQTSVLYGSIRHRIAPHLFGSITGTFQNGIYNGGGPMYDGKSEQYYLLGLDLEYHFNPHLAANIGYDYNRYDSQVGGLSYDENKVYMGITATY